jgi:hypothetical protein
MMALLFSRPTVRSNLTYSIYIYNPKRRHSHVGGVNPEAIERVFNYDL